MEFGSEHVYLNSSSDEEEYIPEEELEEGIVARPRHDFFKDFPQFATSQSDLEPRLDPVSSSFEGHQLEIQNSQPVQLGSVQLENNTAKLLDEDQPRPKAQPGNLAGAQNIPSSSEELSQLSTGTESTAESTVSRSDLCTPCPLPLPPKPPHGILKKDRSKAPRVKGQKVGWMSYLDRGGHKNTLRKYQPTLVELISLPDLLPHLNHHNVVTEEENRLLLDLSPMVPKERVLKLISILSDKSGMVYAAFLQALEDEKDHLGHRQLLNILKAAGEKEFEDGGKHKGVVSRQVDTNVIAITFNTLVNAADVHAGDVVVCSNKNCTAILSHLSKLTEPESDGATGKKEWKCEFCGTCNFVELELQEMPTKEETTYLLTPPPHEDLESAATSGTGGVGNTNLIFCIDVSGSMGVTVEVQGKKELRSDEKLRKLGLSMQADIGNQYMPRQRRDVTYISRLQSVQNAIEEQMAKLLNICPSQRVGVVAFSDEVTLLGDSKWKEVVVAGDRLSNLDELVSIGDGLTPPPPLSQCRAELSKKVSELEEGGQTALGPALLLSVLLAGSIPGSKVIVCTDGLANKGVGNLDVPSDEEALMAAQQFYTDLGTIAVEKGVTVSLVTIKGVECRVLELGRVADATGGNVTLVDPLTVSFEFSNIVANPIIATNVECKLVLHNRLCIQAEGFNGNVMHASVGNVTSDTEYSFEYKARRSPHRDGGSGGDPAGASPDGACSFDTPVMVGGVPHLPFQLLTEYTSKDGSKLLRVVTKLKPVTQERKTAEKGIDFGVVGSHSVRSTAALASEGKIMEARAKAISYGRAMTRSSDICDPQERTKFNAVMSKITPLERQLKATQMRASTNSSVPRSAHLSKPSPSSRSSSQQGQLAQAAVKSSKSKAASFLSPKYSAESVPSPRHLSDMCSPTVHLTDAAEATELRQSATDDVAADLYQLKKVSSKSISQSEK